MVWCCMGKRWAQCHIAAAAFRSDCCRRRACSCRTA
ncbi:hypothetical protein HaLaN_17244, partial [Haematococcus lacustris]